MAININRGSAMVTAAIDHIPDAAGDRDVPALNNVAQRISPVLVRKQLETILASPHFDASDRNRRFLRFIVEECLAGRGDRIKGYSVGISVFDREAHFDPQIDPVVRIEAGRLRRSLERYYLINGGHDPLRILIPKGCYVPQFELNMVVDEPADVAVDAAQISGEGDHSIGMECFASLSGEKFERRIAAALSADLIVEFCKQTELHLFVNPSTTMGVEPGVAGEQCHTIPRMALGGSVRISNRNIRIVAHLLDRMDNRYVWAASFDRELKRPSLNRLERDIAHAICTALVERRGSADRAISKAQEAVKSGCPHSQIN